MIGLGGVVGAGDGAIMREIGGRKDFVVRRAPSRFGRGFVSSINERLSTRARGGGGAGAAAAAAAAACAATRDRAAGVVATGRGRAVFAAGSAFVLFGVLVTEAAGSAATADFADVFRAGGDLRAAVLVVVVRLGMFRKFIHGSRAATLLRNCFSRHRGVDFLRLCFIHTENIDEI